MPVSVYVVLLHTPILNRNGETVTTAVTNMDIHDISRSAKTYGVKQYFIVTPIEDQQKLVRRILDHWSSNRSRTYHPDRFEALLLVKVVESFEAIKNQIYLEHGQYPEVVLTDARPMTQSMSYADYRAALSTEEVKKPVVLIFGTGWGVSDAFYPEVHRKLDPVYGRNGKGAYNHLSVRSAVAIVLDRLFGQ